VDVDGVVTRLFAAGGRPCRPGGQRRPRDGARWREGAGL